MNEEDRRMQLDEREAEPERFPSSSGVEEVEAPLSAPENEEKQEKLERQVTASTSSKSSIELAAQRQDTTISRMTTRHESINLARHPTALSRVQTGRSQQSHTVGASLRSRTITRHSKTPLPNFGDGKEYPPPLPDRDEYVVGFDGPNDPCK